MKITTILLMGAALSGCQQAVQKPTTGVPDFAAACRAEGAADQAQCGFLKEIRWRTGLHFLNTTRYSGQQCQLTVHWDERHRRYNVLSTHGDEPLCLKAWQTLGSTPDLPAPPPGHPAQLLLDFAPR